MAAARWLDMSGAGLGRRIAVSLTLALLPVGLLAFVQSYQSVRHARELEQLAIFGAAERALNRAERSLNEAAGATRMIGAILLPIAGAATPGVCSRMLGDVVVRDRALQFAAFLAPDGTMPCRSDVSDTGGAIDPELLRQLTSEAPGALYLDSPLSPDGPAVHITQPVIADTVHAGWVVTLWRTGYFYSDPVGGELSDTALVDRRGTLFAPSSPGSVPVEIDLAALHDRGREIFTGESVDGRRMAYAAVPLSGGGLTALAARPGTRAASYFTARTLAWSMALPLLMWGISLFVAVLSTNRLATGPLRRLSKMTRAMSYGVRDLSGIQLRGAPTELQGLSDRFMEMSRRVNRYETSLEEALEEKTMLLREVNHRVRNNLQLLVSVLNMQERTASSEAVREALARFRQRVLGLSAAHENLFQAEVLSHPLSGRLVRDVVSGALNAARLDPQDARISVDDVALSQDSVVPLALFVAEAVAEALCADGDNPPRPRLEVTLVSERKGWARLVVERAGADGAFAAARDDLGPRLMRALGSQLGGDVSRSKEGRRHRVELEFKAEAAAETDKSDPSVRRRSPGEGSPQ